ncbi:9736_t:CDS:1, partial [Gigaspora rosea]
DNETDSEPEIDDDKSIEVGPSSKPLSSSPKDKQTTGLPKKKKKNANS